MKDIKAYIDNETISKVNGNFFIEEVNRKKKEEEKLKESKNRTNRVAVYLNQSEYNFLIKYAERIPLGVFIRELAINNLKIKNKIINIEEN